MSSEFKPVCPRCSSHHIVKNGRIHNKKPKYKCLDCGRQFIENPTKKYIDPTILDYIDKMLLEKIPLAGIARVTGVSKKWLQNYVNALYSKVSQQLKVTPKPIVKLIIECDEAWSFVNRKRHKQWIWLALDANTREIVGTYIGSRSRESALKLWYSLPPIYPRVFGGEATPPKHSMTMCSLLYRFLGCLSRRYPSYASQSCWQR